MQVAVGTYTGNGVDGRAITGIGFEPDLVIIKRTDYSNQPMWRSSAMAGDVSAYLGYNAANVTNRIESLDGDGFSVGDSAEVNANGGTYHWWAFRDNGNDDFKVGAYVGNGVDDRAITGLGFAPGFVYVKGDRASAYGWWKSADLAGDASLPFANLGAYANIIQALDADGFTIGTSSSANYNGTDYYWFGFGAEAGICAIGTYTGDGNDDRSISGLGFQPDLVWVKRQDTGYGRARPSTLAGDLTTYLTGGTTQTNLIQALESDGFQLGQASDVNSATKTYYYIAWMEGAAGGPTPKSGSDSFALGEGLGDRALGGADTIAVADAVGDRTLASDDTVGMADGSGLAEAHGAADALTLSESSSVTLAKSVSDTLALGESAAAVTTSLLSDYLGLQVDVIPLLWDQVEVLADVFRNRVTDDLELLVDVMPLLVSDVELEASVRNQALQAAAEGAVIAPDSEVSFL